jgi:serine protease Do
MKKRKFLFPLLSCGVIFTSFFAGITGAIIGVELLDNDTVQDIGDIVNQDVKVVDESSAIIDVAEMANESVVSVVITKDVPVYENNPFFNFNNPRQNRTQQQQVGAGSGFVVSADGMIITNRHVVEDTNASYTVIFNDEKQYEAQVLARDTLLDIAFLKIEATDLKPLALGTATNLKVGQSVIAIGNALGEFSNSVSAGIISGLERDIVASDSSGNATEQIDNVIQTDASINLGNSGGPLLDIEGNVIGVNVAVASDAENIGFAIPIDTVKDLLERLQNEGSIERPKLGVRYRTITDDFAENNDLSVDHGALIIRGTTMDDVAVVPGSPADKAGLRENDIILEVDGTEVNEKDTLVELVQQHNINDTIKLKILRQGEEIELDVKLEKY